MKPFFQVMAIAAAWIFGLIALAVLMMIAGQAGIIPRGIGGGDHQAVPIILAVLYFIPAIVAALRHHHNATAIGVLNLLLGWTLLGWIAALVWAFTVVQRPASAPLEARTARF